MKWNSPDKGGDALHAEAGTQSTRPLGVASKEMQRLFTVMGSTLFMGPGQVSARSSGALLWVLRVPCSGLSDDTALCTAPRIPGQLP